MADNNIQGKKRQLIIDAHHHGQILGALPFNSSQYY